MHVASRFGRVRPSGTAARIAPASGGAKSLGKPFGPTLFAGAVVAPEPSVGIAEDHDIQRRGSSGQKREGKEQAEQQQQKPLSNR